MSSRQATFRTLFGALLLSTGVHAQDVPASGFALEALAPPAALFSQTATFSDGRYVVYDGQSVDLYAADGSFLQNLTVFGAFGFPSFVRIDPDESFLIVAESTNGTISEVNLAGGSGPVANLAFAYDAVFDGIDTLLVSAATCGFGCGNELWRIDLTTGALTQFGQLPGASGPLALDEFGGLYYATVTDQFPVPAGQTDVLYWDAGVIAMGSFLTPANAQVIVSGLDGAVALVKDTSLGGGLYLTENFFPAFSRLIRVGATPGSSEILLEARTGFTLGNLELDAGSGRADFAAYQPAEGGVLTLTSTDFTATLDRQTLAPARAGLEVVGPGTTGPGPFDVNVQGGPPLGLGFIYYCDQALFDPMERAFLGFTPPLLLGLDLGTLGSVPGSPIALDMNGDGGNTFNNPGGIEGNFTLQVILLDGTVVGSTGPANL